MLVKQKLIAIPADLWAYIEAEGGSAQGVIIELLREAIERRKRKAKPK